MRSGIQPHAYRKEQADERKPSTVRHYNWVMPSVLSDWSNKPIRNITRSDIEAKFNSVKRAKGQRTAVKFKRVMNALCNFSMEEKIDGELLLNSNPVKVLSGKRYDLRILSREQFLDDEEIHNLLHYADIKRTYHTSEIFAPNNTDGVSNQGLHFILWVLFAGLRRSECENLKWENFDFRRVFLSLETRRMAEIMPCQCSLSCSVCCRIRRRFLSPGLN